MLKSINTCARICYDAINCCGGTPNEPKKKYLDITRSNRNNQRPETISRNNTTSKNSEVNNKDRLRNHNIKNANKFYDTQSKYPKPSPELQKRNHLKRDEYSSRFKPKTMSDSEYKMYSSVSKFLRNRTPIEGTGLSDAQIYDSYAGISRVYYCNSTEEK